MVVAEVTRMEDERSKIKAVSQSQTAGLPGRESPTETSVSSVSTSGEITTTSLRPDIVVWSTEVRSVLLVELTVPAERGSRPPMSAK